MSSQPSSTPDLSIIIVNWRSTEFLRACLSGLFAQPAAIALEVIVVDNGSNDDCGEMISNRFPGVRFIDIGKNVGFSQANNLGFRFATGKNILFLNPDTEVTAVAIAHLVKYLETHPETAIAGPKLLNTDRSVQTSCIKAFPTILNEVLDSEFLRKHFPRSRLWGMEPLFVDNMPHGMVDSVSGACLMIRREVFEQVGHFSTFYFMYTEDVDLCYKVKSAGWTIAFVGDATIIHHGGQSAAVRDDKNFSDVLMRESHLKFFQIRKGAIYAIGYILSTALTSACRLLLIAILLPFSVRPSSRDQARRAFRKWLRILRWSLRLEPWTQQLQRTAN